MSGRGSLSINRGTTVNTHSDVDSPICVKKVDGTLHDIHCKSVVNAEVIVKTFREARDMIGEDTGWSICTDCLGSDEFQRIFLSDYQGDNS